MAHVATITIDHTKVPGDLTDYVGLIVPDGSAGYSALYALCLEGGGDIRLFKSDDTTELAREMVSFSVIAETGEIHYKYSGTLSSSVDTAIHVYADGSSADYAVGATYGRNAVWTDYTGVYHLQTSSIDSTGNYTGTDTTITYSGAKIGDGALFNSATDRISLGSNTAFQFGETDSFTIQTWYNATARAANDFLFGRQDGAGSIGFRGYSLYITNTSGGIRWDMYSDLGSGGNNTRDWADVIAANATQYMLHLVSTGTSNAAGINLYRDGSLRTATTNRDTLTGSTVLTRSFQIGNRDGSSFGADGLFDEFRVRGTALSANHMETEYNNQNSYSTFYSVAAISSGITQALTASITAATSIITANKWSRALTASATGASSITNIKSFLRTLSAAVTGAVTISRANLLFVTMTAAVSAATTITTESINAVRMRVTAAATATIEKTLSMTQTLTASTQAAASIITVKTFFQTLLAAVSGSASMTATKTFFQTLTAAVVATGIVTRGQITFGVTLSAIIKVKAKLNELFYKKKYTKEDEDYKRKY